LLICLSGHIIHQVKNRPWQEYNDYAFILALGVGTNNYLNGKMEMKRVKIFTKRSHSGKWVREE
jgi:hypothetical protein